MSVSLPTQYFLKELVSSPYYLPKGKAAPFEPVGDDIGVIATSDPGTIIHLSNAAALHIGGIIEITRERYDELKKNASLTPFAPPLDRIKQFGLYLQPETQPILTPTPDLLAAANLATAAVNPSPTPQPSTQPVTPPAPIRPVRRGRIVKAK